MAAIADKPVRRIITVDDSDGKSLALDDSFVDDVLVDPARPGFSSARVWVTDSTPAIQRTPEYVARMPHTLEPPPAGSVFRIFTLPPDAVWEPTISKEAVQSYFEAAGSPRASRFGPGAPHPYMQQTRTLDLCVVLEGEVTLILDTEEVALSAGDTVVQRGTRHAWSNRSGKRSVIAISSHDAMPI